MSGPSCLTGPASGQLTSVERRALADALPEVPDNVIPIYLLRRGLCEAYLAVKPSQFDAAVIRGINLPQEPFGLGTDCHALWDLLRAATRLEMRRRATDLR